MQAQYPSPYAPRLTRAQSSSAGVRREAAEGILRAAVGNCGLRQWVGAAMLGAILAATPVAYGQARPGGVAPVRPTATRPATLGTIIGGVTDTSPLVGRPVARVEVVGTTSETKLILDQVRVAAGQNYQPGNVNDDLRTLAATDRFESVRAEIAATTDDRVVVRYIVKERALVTAVEVVGTRAKKLDDVRELIATSPGQRIDQFTINADIEAIEKFYHKDGYASAKVIVDQKLLREKGIVKYEIAEGPRSRIKSVKMEGNKSLKTSFLKWKINTKSYIWIFRKGVLDEDTVERDVAALRDTYVSKGYLDAQVSRSVEYTADKRWMTVKFIIKEGPQYKIGKVALEGNKVFSNQTLMADSKLTPGVVITRDRVDTMTRRIEDKYGTEGYIYRKVEVITAYTDTPGVVDVTIKVTEGQSFYVGLVIVRGNHELQDRVIRRQIRLYPDQTIDTTKIRKSIERLKATRLVSDVKITPITPSGNPAGVRDLLVEIQESQSGKFTVGAGLSTNSGVSGQFSIEQQNFDILNPPRSWDEFLSGQSFKGAGQYFRILLEPGTELQRYRITFEEPYLLDSPYSFANDAYFFTRSRESYNEQRIGDIITLGRRFGDIWSVTTAFRAEQVGIRSVRDYSVIGKSETTTIVNTDGSVSYLNDSAQQIIDEKGSHFITSIKPAISRDTTDSRIFPTEGTRASLGLEQYGLLGGELDMSKITFRFDWFKTLYTNLFDRKTVFSLRNEFGVIPFGTSQFYERFYGGGIGNLRGFKYRGVGPRSGPPGNIYQDPLGGDFSWVTTAEVNYPIWEEILRGVVFVDVGDVESDLTIGTIRADVGVGVRVQIPFLGSIPLALDVGVPISKAPGDRTQILSFSLGIPF